MPTTALANKKLLRTIFIISALIIARLAYAAVEFQNWRGFFYSSLHVIAVAIFAYIAMHDREIK